MKRRFFLQFTGCSAIAAYLGFANEVFGSERNVNAFDARSPGSVYAALGIKAPVESKHIKIDAPDVAENGANVPVEVSVNLPNLQRVLVIAEKNLFPLLADVRFTSKSDPWVEMKIKLAETSPIRVIAEADGKLYTASRPVRVIVGGCLPG
jgi:sulfur-oxidizing protein SoxY